MEFHMFVRALIASALMLPIAPAAFAEEPRQRSIHYHQNDFTSQNPREEMRRNVYRLARRVCDIHGRRDIQTLRIERDCRRNAIDRAMLQFDRRSAEIHTDMRRDTNG
jgi:UrcA family protein